MTTQPQGEAVAVHIRPILANQIFTSVPASLPFFLTFWDKFDCQQEDIT